MPTINNAIIMAAGQGTRMRPLTNEIAKPLVKVNGTPMIESVINSLQANQITDITVVTGYLAPQFAYLTSKYPRLKLIHNPYYLKYNNISSLYVARKELKGTVILDGDQLINDPALLKRSFQFSGYAGSPIHEWTAEWIMHVDDQGKVRSCDRNGSDHGWRLYSLSKWTAADSQKLRHFLEVTFATPGGRDLYWDDVAMFRHFDQFNLHLQPIQAGAITEIDSLKQLAAIDPSYRDWGKA